MIFAIKGGRQASLLFLRLWCPFLGIVFSAAVALAAPPLSGYNPARLATDPNGPFVTLSAFAADTVLPVVSLIDDSWRGDFTPEARNTADVFWNAATGVTFNGWRVAIFDRGEMFINCNRDTIEFFYRTKKKLDLTTGRIYTADAEVNGFIADGVEVSYGRSLDGILPGLNAGITLRYLDPRFFVQDGTMTGQIVPTGPKSYNFDLFLDYSYNHNIIYNRQDEHLGAGYGFSADVGLTYHRNGWHAEALLRDLGGTIFWNSVPYTTAHAVTANEPTTTNGYQDFEPTIEGYEGNKKLRQRIPLKTDVSIGYDYGQWSGSGTVIMIDDQPRTWFEAAYRFNDSIAMSLAYNLDYGAITWGLAAHGLTVGITTSDFDVLDSHALGLQLSYVHAW